MPVNLITEMKMSLWPAEYKRLVSGEDCRGRGLTGHRWFERRDGNSDAVGGRNAEGTRTPRGSQAPGATSPTYLTWM